MSAGSYRNVFVTNIPTLPTTGTTIDLALGQIGVYDASTYVPTVTPTYPLNPALQIFQGTPPDTFPQGIAKGNQSFRTPVIQGKKVVSWQAKKAQKPQNMIVTMGYDGVDQTKTLAPLAGKEVRFWLTLSGQPMANLLGASNETHYASYTEEFSLDLPCLPVCTDSCGTTVDCNVVADAIISAVNQRKIIGGQLLSKYVKATRLTYCTTPSGLVTTSTTKWSLTIPDTGDQTALGKVEAQYPGATITRTVYAAPYSTYNVVQVSQPSAFQNSVSPLIPNCTTCPSGYTLQALVYVYTVSRTDAGNPAALATLKTNYSDTTAIRLNYEFGSSIYEIHTSSATPPAVVTAGDVIASVGSMQSVCVLSSAGITTPWTNIGTCSIAQKTFGLTIKNDDCGGTALVALQGIYGSGVTLVTTANCTSQYALTIPSSNTSCETCDDQFYTFIPPAPYGQSVWVDLTGTIEGVGCVCGVKFESAYVQRETKECFFDEVSYEYEPLFLNVSERNPDTTDFSQLCEDTFPVTVVQTVKYAAGYGRVVAELYKQSRFYSNDPWKPDPAERDALAYQLNVDLTGYYDQYVLTFDHTPADATSVSGLGRSQNERFSYSFFFPAGQGAAFENAINGYLSSSAIQIPLVNI